MDRHTLHDSIERTMHMGSQDVSKNSWKQPRNKT